MPARQEPRNTVALGGGRAISPPEGWIQDGFRSENPFWLLPKGRLRWQPPEAGSPALHWSLSQSPLPQEHMQLLVALIGGEPGPLPAAAVAPLHPALVRMPADAILHASVVELGKSKMLRVEYEIAQWGEKGIVYYSPTELYEFGEFQILAYEGREPGYGKHLPEALGALASYSSVHLDGRGRAAFSPGGQDGTAPARFIESPFARPWEDDDAGNPERGLLIEDAGSLEEGDRPDETLFHEFDEEIQQAAPPEFSEHVVQPGETIKMIVARHWPGLTADQAMEKVKHIYALNLARGNPFQAWDVKPGLRIYLPGE